MHRNVVALVNTEEKQLQVDVLHHILFAVPLARVPDAR